MPKLSILNSSFACHVKWFASFTLLYFYLNLGIMKKKIQLYILFSEKIVAFLHPQSLQYNTNILTHANKHNIFLISYIRLRKLIKKNRLRNTLSSRIIFNTVRKFKKLYQSIFSIRRFKKKINCISNF